ncbi:integrase [Brevibacillus ruminantium]|uniref:Integrase n=1 Tax=Brevibacillus ruminantium TaxID=2950604 RepID=A0ABY4W9T5_9BACL|nr:integrase [Brevibacillus ruminantium]USG63966.1 integrase [Brevibacillus ruminantium]
MLIEPAYQVLAGTPVDEIRLNHMEGGIEGAHLRIDRVERRVTRIEAHLDADDRGVIDAQARFADIYDGSDDPVLKLDQTKTYATTALSASTTAVSIPVASVTGFKVGQEITICDDTAFENQKITAVGTSSITVAKLTNAYKKGAIVARSTVVRDATAQKMRIGSWGTHTITITQA